MVMLMLEVAIEMPRHGMKSWHFTMIRGVDMAQSTTGLVHRDLGSHP